MADDQGTYECDDGNNDDGDGCTAHCTLELGWACGGGAVGVADTCNSVCQDGWIRAAEECDDGNNVANDGCSIACVVENGWRCYGEPSVCYKITIPSIVSSYINDGMFALQWNETVILKPAWTEDNWDITLSGPITPYDDFKWEFFSQADLIAANENISTWWEYSSG